MTLWIGNRKNRKQTTFLITPHFVAFGLLQYAIVVIVFVIIIAVNIVVVVYN